MKVLFCKISAMKYYKGVIPGKDDAFNGGSYVSEHGEGHEQYNFDAVTLEDGLDYCLGFVETKSTRMNKVNELHIEKIKGCETLRQDSEVEDVLVIWCATTMLNETSVVGWYRHATVYRTYQSVEFDSGYVQYFNILARKQDCVLLPVGIRHIHIWDAPIARKRGYGFGQSLVWYAREENAQPYLERLVKQIEAYQDENWVEKGVDNP